MLCTKGPDENRRSIAFPVEVNSGMIVFDLVWRPPVGTSDDAGGCNCSSGPLDIRPSLQILMKTSPFARSLSPRISVFYCWMPWLGSPYSIDAVLVDCRIR